MKQTSRILFGLLRFVIGIGLLVYLGVSGAINWSALGALGAAWRVTVLALIIIVLDIVVTAYRLCVMMRAVGLEISIFSSVRLALIGTFFNSCLPGAAGGDLVRIYYAAEGNQGRRTEVGTIILLDRVVGMFALITMPLLIAPFFSELVGQNEVLGGLLWSAAAVSLLMLVCLAAVSASSIRNSALLSYLLRKLPYGIYLERIIETVHSFRNHVGALLVSVAISLVAQGMTIYVMLLLYRTMNPDGFSWRVSIVIPLGLLANVLPVTPGGLGVGEAAFDRLFSMAGLTGGAEVMLSWRLLMILIGLAGLVFYLQGRRRLVHQTASLEGVGDESLRPQPQH